MAIDAIDFDGVARLAVEIAVAVTVLLEVAVDAVHSFFQMDVSRCTAFSNFVGILTGNGLVSCVEQVAFAVALEDGAENPAVAVEIGELRVLAVAG